ncbi:MAG: hypothetical protein LBP50_03615 [Tannerella sp.]|nr:hypothetical protein [Tannerella sp.]
MQPLLGYQQENPKGAFNSIHITSAVGQRAVSSIENYNTQEEKWNEDKIITDWEFVKEDQFIWGKEDNVIGVWKQDTGTTISYHLMGDEWGLAVGYTFEKKDHNWKLIKYENLSN